MTPTDAYNLALPMFTQSQAAAAGKAAKEELDRKKKRDSKIFGKSHGRANGCKSLHF